jgi:hypothetical protein
MSTVRALETNPNRSLQVCAVCDADVLFLTTCPACGTPTGSTVAPARTTGQTGQVLSYAEAARARSRTPLPDELTRAWQAPAPRTRPATKSDDWTASGSGRKRTLRLARPLAAIGALLVVALGISVAVTQLADHHSNSLLSPPALTPPQRYVTSGLPFEATFPATPVVSHDQLLLLKLPYTATVYSATSGSSTVSIGVYPLPLGKAGHFSVRDFVRSFLAASDSTPAGTTLKAEGITKVHGMAEVSLATTTSGGRSAGFGTLVLDGHIAYEILAIGPASTVDSTFQQVMRHFRIVNPALGTTF